MKYLKNIAFVLLAFLAIIGVGNGIGYMAQQGAPLINIIGLLIAIVPAVLLAIEAFKKDVTPDK